MAEVASIEEINYLLGKAQDCLDTNTISFVKRKPNMDFLNSIGMSIEDALFMVKILTHEYYYRGPSLERDLNHPPGDMWEFGIPEELPEEVYLKLKELHLCDDVLCLSFHKARFPINYPYRGC
ncbi:hypothetical protein ACQUW6_27270 [Bacillus thuringiensis]|uniref:hypothetical protein n=1 Tax=Bacillus thuringiensis TaxID=1428 RepID=UPI003D141603